MSPIAVHHEVLIQTLIYGSEAWNYGTGKRKDESSLNTVEMSSARLRGKMTVCQEEWLFVTSACPFGEKGRWLG